MQPLLSAAERRAIIARVEARLITTLTPTRSPSTPSACPAPSVPSSSKARRGNFARMMAWVEATRAVAAARSDASEFLGDAHDWLGRLMSRLGGVDRHLRGLTAFDLGEAQIALLRPLGAEPA